METNYAKSAYRTFLFWGVCSSLGVTVSTLVDATLVGNFIGSTGPVSYTHLDVYKRQVLM